MDLLRIANFGAMVVRQTKEYHKNDLNNTSGEHFNANHFFVGGLTGNVDNSVLEVNCESNYC